MRDTVSLKPVKHPRYKFVVTHPEQLPDGSTARRKTYFQTKQEAKAFVAKRNAQLATHGAKHGHVADDERAALIRFRTWSEGRNESVSLLDVINAGIEFKERSAFTKSVHDLIQARILQARKMGSSRRHLVDLDSRLNRFAADFGTRLAADVTATEIEHWIHGLGLSAVSFGNYKRAIGSVFACGYKQGTVPANPIARVECPKVVRSAPSILSPAQLQSLLAAASHELRPLLVLQAFCGVRRTEAERLTWAHIHLNTETPCVELPSEITKTNRRRSVELSSNAVAWLKQVANGSTSPLGLTETVYRRRLRAAAKAAGIKWDENILRHSYGSYRLAQIKNAAQVAEEMGNSPAVVRTHYQNLVRPESVADYWKIIPSTDSETNIIHFSPGSGERKAS
jgi:integrase